MKDGERWVLIKAVWKLHGKQNESLNVVQNGLNALERRNRKGTKMFLKRQEVKKCHAVGVIKSAVTSIPDRRRRRLDK